MSLLQIPLLVLEKTHTYWGLSTNIFSNVVYFCNIVGGSVVFYVNMAHDY